MKTTINTKDYEFEFSTNLMDSSVNDPTILNMLNNWSKLITDDYSNKERALNKKRKVHINRMFYNSRKQMMRSINKNYQAATGKLFFKRLKPTILQNKLAKVKVDII